MQGTSLDAGAAFPDNPEATIVNFRPPRTIVRAPWQRRATAFAFVIGLILLLVPLIGWQTAAGRIAQMAGDSVADTIRAPRRVTFVSQVRTRIARDQAAAQSPAIHDYDSNLLRQFRGRAADFVRNVSAIKGDTFMFPEIRRQQIARLEPTLTAESIDAILSLEDVDWRTVAAETLRALDENVRERLRVEQITERRASLVAQAAMQLTEAQTVVFTDLLSTYLRPNVLVNDVETERVRKEARDRVTPVSVSVEAGELVVRAGDVVTPEDAEKLQALGLGSRAFDTIGVAGIAVYVSIAVCIVTLALRALHDDLLLRPRHMGLIALALIATVGTARLVIPGQPWVGAAFPSAVAVMLVSNLLGAPLAILVAVTQGILLAPLVGYQLEPVVAIITKGFIGAIVARRIDRLNVFFVAGFGIGIANFLVGLSFRLISTDIDVQILWSVASAAAADGVLSAVLTMGSISLVGGMFGLTTMLQLLELAHPSQPLLRRILTEAPGTYHHSILVGNLAERAAEQIGIDALLVRVGAYYHDVGKLQRPHHFAENQFDGDNIHSRLTPEASAHSIIDHVTYGLELARDYRLPPAVQAFVSEHHGTRLAGFFHREAVRLANGDPVDERLFRYPGPRPQSKETALVMLADTVEASVRAASNRSTVGLDQLVSLAVNERILEGELEDSGLTLRDLEVIKRSFVQQLRGVYHRRIEYPPTLAPDPEAARVGGVITGGDHAA
jgi:putative nucleotidyltransferase with HDIG domain